MAIGDRTFKVLLEVISGVLTETVSAQVEGPGGVLNPLPIKKLKRRQMRVDYRSAMKDPSRFPQTDIADINHPTLVLRRPGGGGGPGADSVTFAHLEEFVVTLQRDPEILEDGGDPEGPFTAGGNVFTFALGQIIAAAPANERFQAGPFAVHVDSHNQKFWKFSVVTKSGLKLDPCIIID